MSIQGPSDKSRRNQPKERLFAEIIAAVSESPNFRTLSSEVADKLTPEHVLALNTLPWVSSDFGGGQ